MQKQLPANRLRELRESKGWRPYNVAHLIEGKTGNSVDPTTVWRWEQGGLIRDEYKFVLAELYDVAVPYLMGWDETAAA